MPRWSRCSRDLVDRQAADGEHLPLPIVIDEAELDGAEHIDKPFSLVVAM